MAITEIPVKTALRKGVLPDVFTSSLYSCSPSRGCVHGCLYCDGRAEKYYVEGDFSMDIGVRTGLPALLQHELGSIRERDFQGRRSMISLGSGVTDVYQGTEVVRQVTRRCAEVLAGHDFPVLVITKSSAIQNDLDLWSKVVERGGLLLLMTIAQRDEAVCRRFEPGASSLEARWETLKAFKAAGASVGVLAMPLLPGISDDDQTLEAIYRRAAEVGVDYVMAGGLTLRPGRQKELFLSALEPLSPELEPLYRRLYGEDRPSGSPLWSARADLGRRIAALAKVTKMPFLWPHAVYSRRLPRYESFFLLLQQLGEVYADHADALPRLRQAQARFGSWLSAKRSLFRRHRTLEPTWIDGEFEDLLVPGRFEALLGNDRVAAFGRRVVAGAHFDATSKSLDSDGERKT